MKMIMEVVGGIKDLLFHIIGLGVLVQLVFVGGFLGIDVVGNLINLVNLIGNEKGSRIHITIGDIRITQ